MDNQLSASIMCANPLNMKKDLDLLEENGIDYFHCDIMDGLFVPNLMLSTEIMKAVKAQYRTKLDIHIMAQDPEHVIPWLSFGEGDIVSVHYESTKHVDRTLQMIQDRGAVPALALNPATPVCCVENVLERIGMLLIMTVNPGFAGQKMTPASLRKIAQAREFLNRFGLQNVPIEVDGNCSMTNIPSMRDAGANIFVVGTSSVFSREHGIEWGLRETWKCLE